MRVERNGDLREEGSKFSYYFFLCERTRLEVSWPSESQFSGGSFIFFVIDAVNDCLVNFRLGSIELAS